MVKKTQAAKNALHVSKNYAYLKPSVLRSMAKEMCETRWEACKSYAVSRLPKIAVTATLASLLACGAGLPTHQAWANGFNLPDGSYRYANRDSSTKVQKYVDINAVPCDKNKETDKDKADRATFGQYYKVEYQFNSHGEWWGGRPFWWASVPKDVTIVDNKVALYKHEQLTGGSSSQQAGATYTKDSWNQSASRFWFSKNTERTEFENNWKRMTGEAGGYDNSGDTLSTSKAYMNDTSALIINWESRGNRRSKISFVIKLNNKEEPLKFAAGVYQVMGNWHYTVGKVALAPTLPEYSKELELTYPKDKVEVDSSKYGKNLAQDEKNNVLTKLWEANKNNADVLKKLNGMPETPTEEAFKNAVTINADGSATVTYKDNSTDTIFKENLTKRYVPLSERTKITYPALIPVKNPTALDQSEKKQVEDAIKNANKDKNIKSVTVDANGKATITFDDKIGTPSTKTIEGKYLVKKQRSLADKFTPYYPVPMAVGKPTQLTQGEQTELVNKVYEANKAKADFMKAIGSPSSAVDAKTKNIITVDAQGNVTITYTDKSTDKLDGSKLVYQAKKLNETTYITLPARTAVQDAKKIQAKDQSTIRQAILTANNDLQSKLKGKNENNAITFDDSKHTMTVKFNDDSTSTFDYSELVYTKGNPENPTTETKNNNGYKYNITKIAVADKNKLTQDDWHKFVRKFIQDNWKAKAGKSEINDQYINSTNGLLNQLHAPDSNTGGGMTLYKFFSDWDVTSGSTLKLGDNRSNKGIVSLYQHDDEVEIKALQGWNPNTVITLTKNDCFVSNAAAPKPEELKKEANDLIDKILQKHGLSKDEIDKFKKDHQSDIDKITKPEDVDKIIKSADEHGKDEKKKKDAQQQINDAKNNLGLTPEQKTELDKKIGNETDPEKIREKINEFQKEQDQKKQEEHNKQQQQADQKAEQQQKQQQQKDDTKVDTDIQTQNQQEHQDTGKAEEAKKKAELEKQKQAAIDEINGNDKLKPEDKEQFIKSIQNATDEDAINTIKQQAKEKATQNQTAADSSNNDGLDATKQTAKDTIGKLTNLTSEQKQKYQGDIDSAKDLDKVAEILNNAEFEDAKAAAKKKIAELKQNGSLTEDEANGLTGRIDSAKDLREVEGILEEAELKKAKKDAKSEVDKLTNLNKAQKDALKAEIDDIETDPTNENMKTIEKVKTAITAVVAKAKELDGKMKSLKDLVTLVNGQKSTLTAKPDYKDNKKTAFDSALANASTLVDATKGMNADVTKVDEIKKALEKAVKDLGGKTVDKSALQTLIDGDTDFKKTIAYINAEQTKQTTYDKAITDGKSVLTNANATAEQVTQAVNAINSAKAALNGTEQKPTPTPSVDKSGLKALVDAAGQVKDSDAYKYADAAKQGAYDKAITDGQSVLVKTDTTAGDVARAVNAINSAKAALNGTAPTPSVDKSGLQKEIGNEPNVKKSDDYNNAPSDKKQAYDHALDHANEVNNNPNATQDQVNQAAEDLKKAEHDLKPAPTPSVDKSGLQKEIGNEPNVKNSDEYNNAPSDKKQAYDHALDHANEVNKDPNATQDQVNQAAEDLKNAQKDLHDSATVDKSHLQSEVSDDVAFRARGSYLVADAPHKDAYNAALSEARRVLADPNATQAQVNAALSKLREAKRNILQANGLSGDEYAGDGNTGTGNTGAGNTGTVPGSSVVPGTVPGTVPGSGDSGFGSTGTSNAGTSNTGTTNSGVAGSGHEGDSSLGFGVNDNAPTTVDKGELNLQIQGAESDSQSANAGNAGVNSGNAGANNAANAGNAGANAGNAGANNAANAGNAGANNAAANNNAAVTAAVENNPAVKQADVQVAAAQAALDSALAEAKKVAADHNATQAQVDAAKRKLADARKNLADAQAHAAQVRASVRAQVLKSGKVAQLSNTGSAVSALSMFAATIAAAGAALFLGKRRGTSRHNNE